MNLTPHRLVVLDSVGTTLLDLPATDQPARIAQLIVNDTAIGPAEIPLHTITYGEPTALPHPQPGTMLVVSRVVAQQLSRPDLLFPDDEVRDDDGRIIACRALARFDRP